MINEEIAFLVLFVIGALTLVGGFLYYDRFEDIVLPRGSIEEAVAKGYISIDDMVNEFRAELTKGLR